MEDYEAFKFLGPVILTSGSLLGCALAPLGIRGLEYLQPERWHGSTRVPGHAYLA
jgi:hypothetical protein